MLTLNAGTYHIVSYFGDVNAMVRADLRVEPGQLTEATLYQKAAQVSFKLVSDAGGEAIADVDWTVKSEDGETIFTNTGTFPATVLEEGELHRLGQARRQSLQSAFKVAAGKTQDIEVLTSAIEPRRSSIVSLFTSQSCGRVGGRDTCRSRLRCGKML